MEACSSDKVRYSRRSDAQAAARGIWDEDKVKMYAYQCNECQGYHLATAGTGKTLREIPHGLGSPQKRDKKLWNKWKHLLPKRKF